METRRIRRLQRRRTCATAVLVGAVAVCGVAVGVALPQSTGLAVLLAAVAACCLAVLALRSDVGAPLHGLRDVVRLPLRTSLAATGASFQARIAGSLRALARLRPDPVPLVLDEPDDEAAAWWGPQVVAPSSPAPDEAVATAPVVAAPIRSARVPVGVTDAVRGRIEVVGAAARRRLESAARWWKHPSDEISAST